MLTLSGTLIRLSDVMFSKGVSSVPYRQTYCTFSGSRPEKWYWSSTDIDRLRICSSTNGIMLLLKLVGLKQTPELNPTVRCMTAAVNSAGERLRTCNASPLDVINRRSMVSVTLSRLWCLMTFSTDIAAFTPHSSQQ